MPGFVSASSLIRIFLSIFSNGSNDCIIIEKIAGLINVSFKKPKNLYIFDVIFYVMESVTKLRKVGGSIVATVPKKIIELEGLTAGQTVKISVEKIRKSFLGAAKGIGN